jgi:hypothetical protein
MSKEQLLAQVTLLRGRDAAKAQEAIWTLASAGPDVFPFLEGVLPRPGVEAKINKLIAELADPVFVVRDNAMKQLADLADEAEPSLARAAATVTDLETRRRIELLLRKLEERTTAKWSVQVRRALAVLEYSGTEEARALLERIAQAAPQGPFLQTVQAILKRPWAAQK